MGSRVAPRPWPKALPSSCLFFILLISRALPTSSLNQTCNTNDLNALQSFMNGLQSENLGWSLNSSDCCSWKGVLCDPKTIRVIGLNLANMSLRGTIYAISSLDGLQQLNLSSNFLFGEVPGALFRLSQLETVDLTSNQFSGSIPSDIRLPSIKMFNISNNAFNGSHPILVGSGNLTLFDVGSNVFSGGISSSICISSPMIQVIRFSLNQFSGELPSGFGNCSLLTELSIDSNTISGSLPDDLFKVPTLARLLVHDNQLSGPVNLRIGTMLNLVYLDVSLNNFTGIIPDFFIGLKKLEYFCAESNKLHGSLPSSLSSLSNLRVLNLRNNNLGGQIDFNCTMMGKFHFLDLGSNLFNGSIPDNLSQCSKLSALNLAKNSLTGKIPESFRNLAALTYLSLSINQLSNLSSALDTLQHCPNLTSLVLTRNFKTEVMPVGGIRGFEKIEVLVIANCQLSGQIPPWLASFSGLRMLDISWNNLEGAIPSWFGSLDFLFYMDISNNSLTGEIPNSLTQMKSLISGNSSQQRSYVQNIPFFVKKNTSAKGLQYNQISSFPPSLVLTHNLLVGPISPGFGDLKKLMVLDLSYNSLSGTIPEELSGMSGLVTLQLSHNNLTGGIPSSLTSLNFLSSFDVSNNNLNGPVPTGGQFWTFSGLVYSGNPGLCGYHLHPCPSENDLQKAARQKKNRGRTLGMAIGIGSGTALLFTIAYLLVTRTRFRRSEVSKVVADADEAFGSAGSTLVLLFQNKDNKELCINDIMKATNSFDQAQIVGCGGFGLVYKGTLADGKNVAIKRLSGDFCQMEREFQAEVETLSRAQHTNLVLLQGYCRIANDRLLIYSYMENGSLDYWLHEKAEGLSTLGWKTRLHIAQGAARGLAYLHLSCQPNILHRDIKSSNILLDENFEAHLADFGLARLILPTNTHVTTDLVGTLGYIPPEYGQASVATFKGDVYSFGVVLLELLTGRRPVDMCKPRGSRDLIHYIFEMKKEKREVEVFDPCIYDKKHHSELIRVLEIACLCVSESPKLRPLTQDIVTWLDNIGLEEHISN